MQMKKCALSSVLVLAMVFAMLALPSSSVYDPERDESESPCTVTFGDLSNHSPIVVMGSATAGGLFVATTEMDSIELFCPNWEAAPGSVFGIRMALYEWDTDYASSVAKAPLYAKDFDQGAWNGFGSEWLKLETAGCRPGEYLFVLSGGYTSAANIGVWKGNSASAYAIPFENGSITSGAYDMRINYAYTPKIRTARPLYSPPRACQVDYFSPIGQAPLEVRGSQTAGGLFVATAELDSIEVNCPNWDTANASIGISLYEWKGDYETTVAGTPAYGKVFPDYIQGWLKLDTPSCGPGEYLFLLHDGGGASGTWQFKSHSGYVTTFIGGETSVGVEIMMRANYSSIPDPLREKPSFGVELPPGIVIDPTTVHLYGNPGGDPGSLGGALSVDVGKSVAGLFVATGYMSSIEISSPTWHSATSIASLELYAWDTDYETTVSSAPLRAKDHINYADGAWLGVDAVGLEPGPYLYVFTAYTGNVGVWTRTAAFEYATTFLDGTIALTGALLCRVNYLNEPGSMQAPPYSLDSLLGNPITAPPPEHIIGPDHPINALDVMSNTWAGVDGLGRVLPMYDDLPKKDDGKTRQVGLFYWTWHYPAIQNEPVNISELMKLYPDLHKNNYEDPRWWTLGDWDGVGKAPYPAGPYQNFWDEPLFGYYSSLDAWVLRRHAEMLADAGVDVVIFDNTNGTMTWRSAYRMVFEVFDKARKDGVNTPKISFLLPFGPGENTNSQLLQLYLDIYRDNKYQDLWYYWDGKPLLMAHPDLLPASGSAASAQIGREILSFFTFRPGQPVYFSSSAISNANSRGDIRWDWLSLYPQRIARKNGQPEQMAVGIAQNWTFGITDRNNPRGGLTAFNGDSTLGRAFRYEGGDIAKPGYDTRENAVMYGANFEQQFDYALEVDPEFIFITGWNEWTMGRYDYWPPHSPDPRTIFSVDNAMPDQFSDEFSRDIEPSKGPLKDHYYYQMVSYIRKYKGVDPLPEASGKKPAIDIGGDASQWDDVGPLYRSYKNNISPRDFEGYGSNHYTNATGRNDIIEAKVAHDHDNLYFMVKTQDSISPYTDPNWMRLLVCAGGAADESWEGYHYILNRIAPTQNAATLEKSNGGWDWSEIGEVAYIADGNMLTVGIPKAMLGISGDDFTIDFKWTDNTLAAGDILDFYQYGDTAPGGRFNYRYKSAESEPAAVDSVTVEPSAITLEAGSGHMFLASVAGTNYPPQRVIWTLEGAISPDTAINSNGGLTIAPDETADELVVRATSDYDPEKYGEAIVSVKIPEPPVPVEKWAVDVPYGNPPLDGNITGWGAPNLMDESNAMAWGGNILAPAGYRLAWSEDGLYLAMEITLPRDIEHNPGTNPGATHGEWDRFQFAVNPANKRLGGEGSLWFTFSALESGELHIVREDAMSGSSADVSGYCEGSAFVSGGSFRFAALIPWDIMQARPEDAFEPGAFMKMDIHVAFCALMGDFWKLVKEDVGAEWDVGSMPVTMNFLPSADIHIAGASGAHFVKIKESAKNSRIWELTFTVDAIYSDGSSATIEFTIEIAGNNANLDGEYAFGPGHDLAGHTLIYDIKGNGSNIKAFEILAGK